MSLDPNRARGLLPSERRIFRHAQHEIDHIMSSQTAQLSPSLALEWAWDAILEAGRQLDRLAAKRARGTRLRPGVSVPGGSLGASSRKDYAR